MDCPRSGPWGGWAPLFILSTLAALLSGMSPAFAGPQRETGVKYTAVFIPKFKAPWFDRMEAGLEKAGAEIGINVTQKAPSSADLTAQVKLIEDATNQGADAILVVPGTDPSIESAFGLARTKKIAIITNQSPQEGNADVDVEMIDTTLFGRMALEEMAKAMGSPVGQYAVFVGSFTTPDHNGWADAAISLARQKFPDLKLVGERFPVSEDPGLSRQTALDIIASYPGIKAFLVFGSQGGPGVAQAVREKDRVGSIAVIGTTGPTQAGPFLKDGSLSASILWDPADAGYAMAYLARLVLDGKRSMIGPDLEIPGLGKPISFAENTLIYNRPIVLTRDNVDQLSGF